MRELRQTQTLELGSLFHPQENSVMLTTDLSGIRVSLHDEIFPQMPVALLAQGYPKK
jgi:hypothetical protein